MSRISSLVLFLAACLQAQTTVYLRYGEPGSFSKITGCTNATPVVCTTSTAHGFANGDLVWIQSVYGNWAANGLRKVASATETTFALTTTADANVAGNGAYAHNGIVGRVQPYTIKGHPRMMLDGPGGAWTTAIQGRDQNGYPPYDALKKVADSPGALTHPDRAGPVAYMSALGWHMDSSKTAWLNQAKSIMNNVQNVLISGTTGERFPGLFTASTYGRGSDVDWASHTAVPYAYTYSLIRSQMTSEERTAFLDKMLNNSTDYGESCTQPIQWRTAGRLSTTSGSKIITGTDTDFTTITPGTHIAVLRPNGALYNIPVNWYTVASVQSSNSLTVTASVGFTTSGAMIGVARPWQAGDCGWRWYNRNYGYSGMWDKRVMQFSLVSAIGPSDTTMTVTLAPPKPVPYFAGVDVLVDGVYRTEVVKVTGVNGNTLTVERGQLNTTPLSVPTARVWNVGEPTEVLTPTITRYNPPIETIPYDDPRHNLVITKAFGFIMVGLALADDDPRAAEMFQGAWNYYFDAIYPYAKRSLTGVTQSGGNPGYNTRITWHIPIAVAVKNSLTPTLDITSGDWLRNMFLYFPALETPGNKYGIWAFSDDLTTNDYAIRHIQNLLLGMALFPTDERAQKFNWYMRTRKDLWVQSTFTGPATENNVMYGMMLPGPGETQVGQIDYTAVDPPHFALNRVDLNDGKQTPLSVFTSRTDWGDTATNVFVQAISNPNDHIGTYPGPGGYRIRKGNQLLAGDAGALTNRNFGGRIYSNYLAIGTSHTPGTGWPLMDRAGGSTGYAYARVNNSSTYPSAAAVTRAHRHLLHIKGGADLVVAFDQSETSSAQLREKRFYSYADSYEIPASAVSGCKLTHTRAASRLVTYMLSSSGALACSALPPLDPYPYGSNVKRFTITGMLGSIAGQTTANLWTLSKAWNNTTSDLTDAPAPLSAVGATHEGISLASPAVIVVMPKDGSADVTSTTYTAPHAGEHYVGGMAAGYYDVTVGGVAQPAPPLVGSDGVLSFSTSNSGAVSITLSQSPPPLSVLTASLAKGQLGVSYSAALQASGGTPPYTWRLAGGTLPAGVTLAPSGLLSGTPGESGVFLLTLAVADAASAQAERVLELNVGSASLKIATAELAAAAVGRLYSAALAATGGTPPYTWTLTEGALPAGLTLEGDTIAGTPLQVESSEFTIRLRDSAPSPAEVSATFTLQVQEPEEGGPDVAVIAVTSRRAVLRYNTSAGQACEIKVGDNAAVEPPVFSTLDGGGRLRREFVLGQPAALTPNRQYWVKVVCPSGGTVRSFQTPPTRGAGLSPLKVRVPSLSVRQAAAVEIRYGDSALLGNSVTQSCPAGCEVNLSVPSDEVVYFQIVYKDAGSQTIAASGVRVTAIP